MADMVHGWLIDRIYTERNVDFEPLRDVDGKPVTVELVGSSGNCVQYGNITTSVWQYCELRAVTVGMSSPSLSGIPETLPSPISGSAWAQYRDVDTTSADRILDLWEHTVTYRCGSRSTSQGIFDDMDTPPIPPED